MKLTEFNNKREELGIEGTGINTTTKKEMSWTSKTSGEKITIPSGTNVHVDFSPKKTPNRIWITYGDNALRAMTSNAHTWLGKIAKPPTLKTLEKRCSDGIDRSVLGEKVEIDGFGEHGDPSWSLVFGII